MLVASKRSLLENIDRALTSRLLIALTRHFGGFIVIVVNNYQLC